MLENKRSRFHGALLGLMLDQTSLALVAVVFNSALFVWFSRGLVPATVLYTWFGAALSLAAVRLLNARAIRGQATRAGEKELKRFIARTTALVLVSCSLWGVMGGALTVPSNGRHLTLTAFMLAGMTAGAVGAYSVHRPVIFPMVALMVGPLVVRLGWEGEWEMSLMAGLFLVLMGLVGRNIHKQAVRAIRLGLENEELVHRLNDASHEIRTPISSIIGFAEFLCDHESADPAVRKYATIIHRNSQYLKKLVDHLLSISQAESEHLDEPAEEVTLADQIQLAVDVVSKKAREKGLTIKRSFAPEAPVKICVKTVPLQQILINLLGNAVKFTETGEIRIDVRSEHSGQLSVRVSDTGIGMAPEAQELVFQPFWRENRAEVRSQEGSGLGLTLARSLARNMGGELRLIQSSRETGSTFELRLPVGIQPSPAVLICETPSLA